MNYKIIDEYIGKKIMDTRIKRRFTVVEMSDLLNISRQAYYDYESGKASIPTERCIKICKYLGIDYLKLMQSALDYTKKTIMAEAEHQSLLYEVIDDVMLSDEPTTKEDRNLVEGFLDYIEKEDK